jgi:hypothetical protein
MLWGMLRCGACGAGMSTNGKDKSGRIRIRCSAATESGTCRDAKTFYLHTVESAILAGLEAEMRHPSVIAEYVRTYLEERKRLSAKANAKRAHLNLRLVHRRSRALLRCFRYQIPEMLHRARVAMQRRRIHLGPSAIQHLTLASIQRTLPAATSVSTSWEHRWLSRITPAAKPHYDCHYQYQRSEYRREDYKQGGFHQLILARQPINLP